MTKALLLASDAGMFGLCGTYCGNAVDSDSGFQTAEISNLRKAEAVITLKE